MDIGQLDSVTGSEEGREFEVKNPRTGQGIGWWITMYGPDSTVYKAAVKDAMKRVTDKTTKEDMQTMIATACLKSWRGEETAVDEAGALVKTAVPVTMNGVELRFSEEAIGKVFKALPTVREQCSAFMEDRANFLPLASGS